MPNKLLDSFYLNNHPDGKAPQMVVIGTLLLYLAVALQMVSNLLDGVNLAAFIFIAFFLIYLVFVTGEGRKWARVVLLILILLNSYALVANITHPTVVVKQTQAVAAYKAPAVLLSLFVVEVVIELLAMVLVFSKEAKPWFNRVRKVVN
jgi:cytochrome bd-type quinol oxidase subunit 2